MNWIVFISIAFALGAVFYALHISRLHNNRGAEDQLGHSFQLLLQQLNALSTRVDERLRENTSQNERTHQNIGERLDNAAKVINAVTGKLSQLEEANKKIYDVGKDISSLQEILRAPKLRGNLGELLLGDLLAQILPQDHFSLQYKFKTGAIVDAIIHLRDDHSVPVDAKFPLENFKRILSSNSEADDRKIKKIFQGDVQKHIDAIASRYILPDEGTLDFALMYVPAENIYYEIIVKDQEEKSINQYALSKRVIPVSPNTFYIYLQAIVMGLRGLQIESGAKDILKTLGRLKTDFSKFEEDFVLVGTHLGRAHNSYLTSEKRLNKFQDKLEILDGTVEQPPSIIEGK